MRLIYPIMTFGLVENSSLRPEQIDRFGLPSGGCSLVSGALELNPAPAQSRNPLFLIIEDICRDMKTISLHRPEGLNNPAHEEVH